MDNDHATFLFQLLAAAAIAGAFVGGVSAYLRDKNERGDRSPLLAVLLLIAVTLVSVAVLHVAIGSQITEEPKTGLWAEGTISALPSSVVALGTTFLTVWAVLWTDGRSQEIASRSRQRDQAEARRFEVREVEIQLKRLDKAFLPIRKKWLEPEPTRALELWEVIRGMWDRLLFEGGIKDTETPGLAPPRIRLEEHPPGRHSVALPINPNVYQRWEESGTIDPGCVHFQEAIYSQLRVLHTMAAALAVNQVNAAEETRTIMSELLPSLQRYDLSDTELLEDARLLSDLYPAPLPEKTKPEGRAVLGSILAWVATIHVLETNWMMDFQARVNETGFEVVTRPITPAVWDNKAATWDRAKNAFTLREALRSLLDREFKRPDNEVGRMSRLEFWDRISTELRVSQGHNSVEAA